MPASTAEQIKDFIAVKNGEYETLHQAFEEQFWGTKMALTGDFTADELTRTKQAMESWLADPGNLKQTREYLQNLPKGVTDFEVGMGGRSGFRTLLEFSRERARLLQLSSPHVQLVRNARKVRPLPADHERKRRSKLSCHHFDCPLVTSRN